MYIPDEGYMAVPWQIWEEQYLDMVSPLTGAFAGEWLNIPWQTILTQ